MKSSSKQTLADNQKDNLAATRLNAYNAVQPLLKAASLDGSPNYGLDATYASSVAVNSARRVAPFKDVLAKLHSFDYANVGNMELLGQALLHVQGEINVCSKGDSLMAEYVSEGYALRLLLLSYAQILVLLKKMDEETVARIREGSGYRDLVEDLQSLVALFTHSTEPLTGPITKQNIERAAELSVLLGKQITAEEDREGRLPALLAERRRIAAALGKAHHHVHRAMVFLRDEEGDADQLVPSLYVPAGARSPKTESNPQAPSPASPGASPTAPAVNPLDKPFDNM